MKWIILIPMIFLCLSNCFTGGNTQRESEKKMKEEILREKMKEEILLLNNNEDVHKAVEFYFEKEKIKYSYWRGKIESSRIGKLLNDGDSVYFAIYREEKKIYIITHYVVYIIIDSNDKIKEIIFDTMFTGS